MTSFCCFKRNLNLRQTNLLYPKNVQDVPTDLAWEKSGGGRLATTPANAIDKKVTALYLGNTMAWVNSAVKCPRKPVESFWTFQGS